MSAAVRRSGRSMAARAAGGQEAAAVDAAAVGLPAAEQPRKRPRRAAAAAAALVVEAATNAAADQAAAEAADAGSAAAPTATGRGRGGKAKAAAAGPSREMEQDLWQQGYARVAGVDEAGRGPLAGGRLPLGGAWPWAGPSLVCAWCHLLSACLLPGMLAAPLLQQHQSASWHSHAQRALPCRPAAPQGPWWRRPVWCRPT